MTSAGVFAQSGSFSTTTTNYDAAGGTVTFDVNYTYTGETLSSLGFEFPLPDGWSYASTGGTHVSPFPPVAGDTGVVGFVYINVPTDSTSFTMTLNYSSGLTGDQTLTGRVLVSSAEVLSFTPVVIAAPPSAPAITDQPDSLTIDEGDPFSFSVTATGNPAPTYQWFHGDNALTGETSSTFSRTSSTTADAGSYTVTVSNGVGTAVTSDAAMLSLNTAPVITTDPASQTINEGQPVSFTVVASGTSPLAYQWFKGQDPISGATAATYMISVTTAADAGSYSVVVSNDQGDDTSASADLTIIVPPVITTPPAGKTALVGDSVTFDVVNTGTSPFTFQWFKDSTLLNGKTSSTLTVNPVTVADAGSYTVVVTNPAGFDTSAAAVLTVEYAPIIITDPTNKTQGVGGTTTFTVVAEGNPAPTYQWNRDSSPITGETNATLTLTNVQLSDSGAKLTVDVINTHDTVTSAQATLTVNEGAAITGQPTPQTVEEGQSASFTVTATGNPDPTYQWMKNGSAISGATSATYSIPATARTHSGEYTVVVSNGVNDPLTSDVAVLDVQFAPEITQQPTNKSVGVGGSVTFSLAGAANPTPTFQWYRNDSAIDGAIAGDLTLTGLTLKDSGSTFYLIATNGIGVGFVKSDIVTLTVNEVPVITLDPVGVELDLGDTLTLMVAATGTPTPTFQWRKNGTAISGATSPTYTVASVGASHAGTYDVVISNAGGDVISKSAVVTVRTPPVITAHPTGKTALVGGSVTFTVAATGSTPLEYQWFKGETAISGANGNSYTIAAAVTTNAGDYTVKVSNGLGSAISNVAKLTVNVALREPKIISQPTNQTVLSGSPATFTVVAEGNPAPSYQWSFNQNAITGATGASYTIPAATAANAGSYEVLVSNSEGQVPSNLVRLTVTSNNQKPVITSQPKDKVAALGASTSFTVVATGVPAPTYQWMHNNVEISGATSATLTIASVTQLSAGNYSVIVENTEGPVLSRNANLRVIARSYQGTYFGSFGPGRGSFAIHVREDNTGYFIGFDLGVSLFVSGSVTVADDGSFTFTTTTETTTATTALAGAPVGQDLVDVFFSARIGSNGSLTGTVTGVAGLEMLAEREPTSGTSEGVAGFYESGNAGTSDASYTIISPNGKVIVLTKTASGSDAGVGSASASGAVQVTTVKNNTISATISSSETIITEVTDSMGGTTVFAGGSETVIASQRLANISSRARAGLGSATPIAGLVISGEDSKSVLIRAVGPSLAALDVPGFLANPKLDLVQNGEVIASATNWSAQSNTDELMAASVRAGAFALEPGSADAVLLETLAPGIYTALASGADGGEGIVLVEVYDLSTPAPGQKLLNISTRASVGSGNDVVIAGLVVSGSVPKRVLVRGAGPGLTERGVVGALVDPVIRVFKGDDMIASNDNWSADATSAAAVAAANTATGAFELTAGSADAAIVLNLAPGVYSVHLGGVGGASGIGLIEVYEVP